MSDQERPSRKRTRQRRRVTGDRGLGDRIRKFRTQLNLSQAAVAHQIGRTAGWLLQVENGRADPGYSDLLLLATVLKLRLTELLPVKTAAESENGPGQGHSAVEEPVDRRRFNSAVVGSLFSMPTLLDWERADAILRRGRVPDSELLGQVERLVSAITTTTVRQLDIGSPEQLAPMLHGVLTFVQSLGTGHQSPPPLAHATATLTLLYGWLSFQMDNKSEARRNYRYAVDRARAAGLINVQATVLAAASQLDSTIPYGGYGSSNLSLVTLNHAHDLLQPVRSASVLHAWILARRAQERSALGDLAGARRDLAAANCHFQSSAVTPETFYAYPSDGWIIGYEASCSRLGQRWAEAQAAYSRVLTHPSSPLWRSVTMSSLASVLAGQGDPGQAARMLRQAVGLAIETNAPLRLRHVYGSRAQLDQFRDTPAVQEFDQFLSQVTQV